MIFIQRDKGEKGEAVLQDSKESQEQDDEDEDDEGTEILIFLLYSIPLNGGEILLSTEALRARLKMLENEDDINPSSPAISSKSSEAEPRLENQFDDLFSNLNDVSKSNY